VKYVCCGGCRQWLLAPKDAVVRYFLCVCFMCLTVLLQLVACSNCDVINNCSLVEGNRSQHQDPPMPIM
jgi:hypothetical protein